MSLDSYLYTLRNAYNNSSNSNVCNTRNCKIIAPKHKLEVTDNIKNFLKKSVIYFPMFMSRSQIIITACEKDIIILQGKHIV